MAKTTKTSGEWVILSSEKTGDKKAVHSNDVNQFFDFHPDAGEYTQSSDTYASKEEAEAAIGN